MMKETEKKQIEEMAKVLKAYTKKNNIMASHVILECYAEELYKAGFCKQEWISVDERLPELYKDVITYDMSIGVGIDSVLSNGEFVLGHRVTHWMPLPEAPKMKNTEN